MANHLKVAMIHAIVMLHQRGWSKRRIARELGVDRGSVGRRLAGANAASGSDNPPHGSPADRPEADASNAATGEANPPLGSNADLTGLVPPSDVSVEGAKAAGRRPTSSAH
jgi:Homeodomain-like domain